MTIAITIYHHTALFHRILFLLPCASLLSDFTSDPDVEVETGYRSWPSHGPLKVPWFRHLRWWFSSVFCKRLPEANHHWSVPSILSWKKNRNLLQVHQRWNVVIVGDTPVISLVFWVKLPVVLYISCSMTSQLGNKAVGQSSSQTYHPPLVRKTHPWRMGMKHATVGVIRRLYSR